MMSNPFSMKVSLMYDRRFTNIWKLFGFLFGHFQIRGQHILRVACEPLAQINSFIVSAVEPD